MSSSSPQSSQAGNPGGNGQDKGALSTMNMSFLKGLTEKRITRDGNPPKRRGPKPDSKPALTRRQELNRQAQRYALKPLQWPRSPCAALQLREADHAGGSIPLTGHIANGKSSTSRRSRTKSSA